MIPFETGLLDTAPFFAYVHEYFEIARNAAGTPVSLRVHEVLKAIEESKPTTGAYPEQKDKNGAPFASGYLPERRLLWIRYSELNRLCEEFSPNYPQEFRSPEKPLIRDTTAFVTTGRHADRRAEEDAALRAHLPKEFSPQLWAVVVGVDARQRDVILWIGLTRDLSLAELPLDERWMRLRFPVRRFTEATPPAWVDRADVQASLPASSPETFKAVVRAALALNGDPRATPGSEEIVRTATIVSVNDNVDSYEGTAAHDLRLIWYPSHSATAAEQQDLLAATESHAGFSEEIIVATRGSQEQGAAAVQPLLDTPALLGADVRILDAGALAALLGAAPWIWSEHFGDVLPFHVIYRDHERLKRLLGVPLTSWDVIDNDNFVEPQVIGDLKRYGRVRVIGRPGSGKTTSLYHAAKEIAPTHPIVLLRTTGNLNLLRTLTLDEIALLKDLARGLARDWPALLFLVDDGHLGGPGADNPVRVVMAVANEVSDTTRPAVCVTYDQRSVAAAQNDVFRAGRFSDVELRQLGRDEVRELLVLSAQARGLDDQTSLDEAVEWVRSQEATRGCVQEWFDAIQRQEFPRGLMGSHPADVAFWSEQMTQLTPGDREAAFLLRSCALLRDAYSFVPLAVAKAYFTSTGHHDFASALLSLTAAGWLVEDSGELLMDDYKRLAIQRAFHVEGYDTSNAEITAFAEWVISDSCVMGDIERARSATCVFEFVDEDLAIRLLKFVITHAGDQANLLAIAAGQLESRAEHQASDMAYARFLALRTDDALAWKNWAEAFLARNDCDGWETTVREWMLRCKDKMLLVVYLSP